MSIILLGANVSFDDALSTSLSGLPMAHVRLASNQQVGWYTFSAFGQTDAKFKHVEKYGQA